MFVLVTGATGFIGRHVVRRLLESGHGVRALVRQTADCAEMEAAGVEVVRAAALDGNSIPGACQDVDIIINLAGRMGGPSVTEKEMREVNVSAVQHLMESCQKSNVRHFIHCSTPGVLGMVGIAPECLPYRPTGSYERTKCEGEKTVLLCHKNGCVPATIIRPDFVYGPGDMHKLKMFEAIKEGRFPIIGGGRALLHPTYIDDVVRGIMLVMDNPEAHGHVFNIAGPSPVRVAELVDTIARSLGVRFVGPRVPVAAAKLAALGSEVTGKVLGRDPKYTRYQVNFFTKDHASDTSKAQQMLGFRAQVSLQEGIDRTVSWYKDYGFL